MAVIQRQPVDNVNGLSGTAVEGSASKSNASPLRIIIIGAGIGGLATAVYLRQQGHHVTLLEQSRFANEVGAAMHLAPNANGLLRRIGVFAETIDANTFERVRVSLST